MQHRGTILANTFPELKSIRLSEVNPKQNNNMKNLSKTLLTTLAVGLISCGMFVQQAQADQIQGDINFTGQVTYDTGNVGTANSVTGWFNTFVGTASGDFSGLDGAAATFTAPWVFDPPSPRVPLWTVGGFTFDLTTSSIVFQTTSFGGILVVQGNGIITAAGFDPTAGTWSFTSNGPGADGQFSFSAGTSAVPDGGATVMLLGLALAGVGALRRKLKTS